MAKECVLKPDVVTLIRSLVGYNFSTEMDKDLYFLVEKLC